VSSGLHAETSVVDPEHKVRALAVTTLAQLPVSLIGRRSADITIQAEFNSHPGSLGTTCE
jgi:hypothetical protein